MHSGFNCKSFRVVHIMESIACHPKKREICGIRGGHFHVVPSVLLVGPMVH